MDKLVAIEPKTTVSNNNPQLGQEQSNELNCLTFTAFPLKMCYLLPVWLFNFSDLVKFCQFFPELGLHSTELKCDL